MSTDNIFAAIFGSGFFWLFVAWVGLFSVILGVAALVSSVNYKREQRRYSAEAYEQLRVRQEFRRIVEELDQ